MIFAVLPQEFVRFTARHRFGDPRIKPPTLRGIRPTVVTGIAIRA
jgi:hypothetical protein